MGKGCAQVQVQMPLPVTAYQAKIVIILVTMFNEIHKNASKMISNSDSITTEGPSALENLTCAHSSQQWGHQHLPRRSQALFGCCTGDQILLQLETRLPDADPRQEIHQNRPWEYEIRILHHFLTGCIVQYECAAARHGRN